MRLIIFGPPGVGKGTQAQRIVELYGLVHISTGDAFRNEIRQGTELGARLKRFLDEGTLVPDELVGEIMEVRLRQSDCRDGYILDGFPRTLNQARVLDELLCRQRVSLSAAIFLEADDEVIVQRISGRRVCPVCGRSYHVDFAPSHEVGRCDDDGSELEHRLDDRPESVRRRLQVYAAQTVPLREHYRKQGILLEIDGSQDANSVAAAVEARLVEKS